MEWGGSADEPEDVDVEAILRDAATDAEQKRAVLQQKLVEAAQNGSAAVAHDILGDAAAAALVDVDARDAAGSTALVYASIFGHEHVVAELLGAGAAVDQPDQNEWTPLMWAAQNQHFGIVRRLLEQGADAQHKTSGGRSAVDVAVPGSAIALYFSANGLGTAGDDAAGGAGGDFYKPVANPADVETHFQQQLEESSAALGLTIIGDDAADADALGAFGFGGAALGLDAADRDEFDWDRYRLEQSFALSVRDIPRFLDLVVSDVRPTLKKNQPPLSANAIFLVLRFFHYNGPADAVVGLLNPLGRRVLRVVEEHKHDLSYVAYWLVNIHVLLYYMRRDAGVNLATHADFQLALEELLETLTATVVGVARELLEPLLRPCLLDYENIPGLDAIRYRGAWSVFHRQGKPDDPVADTAKMILPPSVEALRKPAPRKFTAVLSSLVLVLDIFGAHPIVVQEVLSQLLYWLGAAMANAVLRNRKYLARARAMQIRLNLSFVEDWCRNNNRRPSDGDEFSTAPAYKSLVELARAHLAPATEILQWLQVFSGLGTDFTNVIAALQELKSLNPNQLLYAAKHYRSEVNEPALSKDYRIYLQELAAHYKTQQAAEEKGAAQKVVAEKAAAETAAAGAAAAGSATKPVEPIPKTDKAGPGASTPEDAGASKDGAAADARGGDAAAPSAAPPASLEGVPALGLPVLPEPNPITVQAKTITAKDIYLDAELVLPFYVPSMRELVAFWGGGLGGADTQSAHYFVPTMPGELADALDAGARGAARAYEDIEAPALTQTRRDEAPEAPADDASAGGEPAAPADWGRAWDGGFDDPGRAAWN